MDINQFQVYSAVSVKEKQNTEEFQNVLELIKKLDSFENSDEVKQFLREDLNIKDSINNYPLKGNGILNYTDYEATFSVEIIHEKKHSVFCFNK